MLFTPFYRVFFSYYWQKNNQLILVKKKKIYWQEKNQLLLVEKQSIITSFKKKTQKLFNSDRREGAGEVKKPTTKKEKWEEQLRLKTYRLFNFNTKKTMKTTTCHLLQRLLLPPLHYSFLHIYTETQKTNILISIYCQFIKPFLTSRCYFVKTILSFLLHFKFNRLSLRTAIVNAPRLP